MVADSHFSLFAALGILLLASGLFCWRCLRAAAAEREEARTAAKITSPWGTISLWIGGKASRRHLFVTIPRWALASAITATVRGPGGEVRMLELSHRRSRKPAPGERWASSGAFPAWASLSVEIAVRGPDGTEALETVRLSKSSECRDGGGSQPQQPNP